VAILLHAARQRTESSGFRAELTGFCSFGRIGRGRLQVTKAPISNITSLAVEGRAKKNREGKKSGGRTRWCVAGCPIFGGGPGHGDAGPGRHTAKLVPQPQDAVASGLVILKA
jgi:hypothetical protein